MERTVFKIEKMDCSSEEQLVRMKLDGIDEIERLEFDLPNRQLAVYHRGNLTAIRTSLEGLELRASQVGHESGAHLAGEEVRSTAERGPLIAALVINASLFVGEMIAGILAASMGLVADSLDMLADTFVYALSLAAVGGTGSKKKRIARMSGYFQLLLAIAGVMEVMRRFVVSGDVPDFTAMIVVSGIALLGNLVTLLILTKTRDAGAHMKASWIFTSNDIMVNLLVIASGVIVYFTTSKIPDLLAGGIIFVIVANGARRILALSR